MSRDARKLVLRVQSQKQARGKRLEIPDLERRHVVKTKGLISYAVIVKLICAFVFAKAKFRFSHDAAHIIKKVCKCEVIYIISISISL